MKAYHRNVTIIGDEIEVDGKVYIHLTKESDEGMFFIWLDDNYDKVKNMDLIRVLNTCYSNLID